MAAHFTDSMNIHPTSSTPVSTGRSTASGTPDAGANAPKFSRTARDGAPGAAAYVPWPQIDPSASAEEQQLFKYASDMSGGGDVHSINARLFNMLRRGRSEVPPTNAQFTFNQMPASVQISDPRLVINVGSDDDGSASQFSLVNNRIAGIKGASMNNPLQQTAALQRAATAICLGIAQQNNMPHAVAAIQEVQSRQGFLTQPGT
jgi:hypothetical protein